MIERQRAPWRKRWVKPGTHAETPKETALYPLRFMLAAGWLRAGTEKMIRANWWDGDDVRAFLDKQHDEALAFWRPVMEHVLFKNAITVAVFVVIIELAVGIAILVNRGTTVALWWGVVLNVTFVMSGVVNPSVFYLAMEMTLLLAWTNRAVGMKPQQAQWFILTQTIAWVVLMILMLPFIRTLKPEELIGDPASTLALMSAIMVVVMGKQWWTHRQQLQDNWLKQI